jgi:hypothetical protein
MADQKHIHTLSKLVSIHCNAEVTESSTNKQHHISRFGADAYWRDMVSQECVARVGQERLGPSYFFISLVLGPLNSLLWYVPSSRYIWSSTPIFCFLQEKIKEIIIIRRILLDQPTESRERPCGRAAG